MTPAHYVPPASLEVHFDTGGRDMLDFGPFFVLVRGWLVPVYDSLYQKVRFAKPTLNRNDHSKQ
jgi:hypothetical protein